VIDSALQTLEHSRRVGQLLLTPITQLLTRAFSHDESKLHPPEKAAFDSLTPFAADEAYGGVGYKARLALLMPALEHHYRHNRHHPEHHRDGVAGMTLVDLMEMLADWAASCERHEGSAWSTSFEVSCERFEVTGDLKRVLWNTACDLGYGGADVSVEGVAE
jgi:hypothetical protein